MGTGRLEVLCVVASLEFDKLPFQEFALGIRLPGRVRRAEQEPSHKMEKGVSGK